MQAADRSPASYKPQIVVGTINLRKISFKQPQLTDSFASLPIYETPQPALDYTIEEVSSSEEGNGCSR